jgi:hypothetical protein
MQHWLPFVPLTLLVIVAMIVYRPSGGSRRTSRSGWGGSNVPVSDGTAGTTSFDCGPASGGDGGAGGGGDGGGCGGGSG